MDKLSIPEEDQECQGMGKRMMKENVQREVRDRTCRSSSLNSKDFGFYSECVGKTLDDIVQGSDIIKFYF